MTATERETRAAALRRRRIAAARARATNVAPTRHLPSVGPLVTASSAQPTWPPHVLDAFTAITEHAMDEARTIAQVLERLEPDNDDTLFGVYDGYLEEFTEAYLTQREAEERAVELNDLNFNSYDRKTGAEERYSVDKLPIPYPAWAVRP